MSRDTWKGSKRAGVHGALVVSLNRPGETGGGEEIKRSQQADGSIGTCARKGAK
jgi:hypothetical protein